MKSTIVYPESVLRPNTVDEYFKDEHQTAKKFGFNVKLVDFRKKTFQPIQASQQVLYRGWMMYLSQYEWLSSEVNKKDSKLFTTPENFKKTHFSDNWIDLFSGLPTSIATQDSTKEILTALSHFTGKVFVKDSVKSNDNKNLRVLDTSWSEERILQFIKDFKSERGKLFPGTFIFKEFVEFSGYELRTWWFNGEMFLTNSHGSKILTLSEINTNEVISKELQQELSSFDNKFITADFGLTTDGKWQLIEIGDGQVSGLDEDVDYSEFYEELFYRINSDK